MMLVIGPRSVAERFRKPPMRRAKLVHRILILFLVALLPIQWAMAVACSYCHLGAESPVQGLGFAALHVHEAGEPLEVAHTGSIDGMESAQFSEDSPTPSAEKCETCKVVNLMGPALVRHDLQPVPTQALRPGGEDSLAEADRRPPEFVPI